MTNYAENSGQDQVVRTARGRFAPGHSGNRAGKPRGSRHRASLAAEVLLDGEAEALTRRCIDQALSGDMLAMRLCMERLLPVRRERLVKLALPKVESASDAVAAMSAAIREMRTNGLSASELAHLAHALSAFTKIAEGGDLARRIERIEAALRVKAAA